MSSLQRVQRLSANSWGRDYVVGDIHGHFFVLERLLAALGFDPERDRLLSVGDLIDRGPDSERALDFLACPWFYAIRGNHEQMLLDAVGGTTPHPGARAMWYQNGGAWFETVDEDVARQFVARLSALPHALAVTLTDGTHAGLLHADVPGGDWPELLAGLDDDEAGIAAGLLWSRRRAQAILARLDGRRDGQRLTVAGLDRVFFGHTPMPAPIACGNTRWLDTGAFLPGGHLTVAALDDRALWAGSARGGCQPWPDWRWLEDR